MNTYRITFIGRERSAIGKFYSYTETVTAKDEESAITQLYSYYDHIRPTAIIKID